jgi:hypothetical protein
VPRSCEPAPHRRSPAILPNVDCPSINTHGEHDVESSHQPNGLRESLNAAAEAATRDGSHTRRANRASGSINEQHVVMAGQSPSGLLT